MKGMRQILTVILSFMGLVGPSLPGHAQESLQRLRELHQHLMDPTQFFSISKTLAELDELETTIPPGDNEARGKLNYLRGFVLYRAQKPTESLPPSLEALRIDAITPFLPDDERTSLIYNIASQAEEIGDWSTAIQFYEEAMPLFDASAEYSEDQRFALRERQAYCLHEAGRYAEALALNKQTLEAGEKLFGPDSEKLLVVVTNISQNAYVLGDLKTTQSFLERLLATATKHDEHSHIDNALFLLGVLAFEQDRFEEAEAHMKRRLSLAEASSDSNRINSAREDLEILYEKMSR